MDAPATPDDPPTPTPGHDAQDTPGRTRTWIAVVLVAVALAVGALTAVLLVRDASGVHDGAGTATFSWTSAPTSVSSTTSAPLPQDFTGQIEGHDVEGTARLIIPQGGIPSNGVPTPLFRYQGTFAGSSFVVTVSFDFPTPSAPGDIATAQSSQYVPRITITGTYGGASVHGRVITPAVGGPAAAGSRFVGTIGNHAVVGTFSPVSGTGSHRQVTASFVVRG